MVTENSLQALAKKKNIHIYFTYIYTHISIYSHIQTYIYMDDIWMKDRWVIDGLVDWLMCSKAFALPGRRIKVLVNINDFQHNH